MSFLYAKLDSTGGFLNWFESQLSFDYFINDGNVASGRSVPVAFDPFQQKVTENPAYFATGLWTRTFTVSSLSPYEIASGKYNGTGLYALELGLKECKSGVFLTGSGLLSSIYETGSVLDLKINALSGNNYLVFSSITGLISTGQADGRYYPLNINPSGYLNNLSGLNLDIFNTGKNTYQLITGLSGSLGSTFYSNSNPNGYLNSLSGLSLSYTTGFSGVLNQKIDNSGSILDTKINALSGNNYLLSTSVSGYITTGQSDLRYYLNGNPSGYLNSLSGIFTNLFDTGKNLYQLATGLSGSFGNRFYTANNPSGFITNLSGLSVAYVTGISGILEQKINSLSGSSSSAGLTTGDADLRYYSRNTNLSGYLNSLSGLSTSYILNISGHINDNLSTLSTNLISTGSHLYSLILGVSGSAGSTGAGGSPGGTNREIQYNDNGNFAGSSNINIQNGDLSLKTASSITTPETGFLKIFSRSIAGRLLPAFIGPAGLDSVLQPNLGRNKIGHWSPPGNANTAPTTVGLAAPTATGTATARNVATTNFFTSLRRLGYVSNAASGQAAGLRLRVAQFFRGNRPEMGGFHYICRFGISDAAAVAQARTWVGMTSSTVPLPANTLLTGLANSIGLTHQATEQTFSIYHNDGSGPATVIPLGTGFPCTGRSIDAYDFSLFCPPNANYVGYQVQRLGYSAVATGVITTKLPVSTTFLAPQLWRTNGTTAAAVALDFISLYIETDY